MIFSKAKSGFSKSNVESRWNRDRILQSRKTSRPYNAPKRDSVGESRLPRQNGGYAGKKLAAAIFFIAFALMLLGMIIVMSASSTYSASRFDSVFHLFNSHVFNVLLGIGFMILFCFVPYESYRDNSKLLIFLITFILIATLFLAENIKGAGRRLDLGLFSFQPAEAAKLVLIMHLAALIEDKGEMISNFKYGFLYLFIWIAIISFLILMQPNFSNAIILVMISLTILYVGGAKLRHIISSSAATLFVGGIVALFFSHARSRILSFIDSILSGGYINLQVKQAILSLGSGEIFGVGIGHSRQSDLFLPESYGDFIFAILGEELGFIGAIAVLICYFLIFIAGILIAKKSKDRFGQLLAFGISFTIIIYAFINAAVTTGLLPTTGLPLPFISYGGTSIIFLCISIGILVNIAVTNSKEQIHISKVKV